MRDKISRSDARRGMIAAQPYCCAERRLQLTGDAPDPSSRVEIEINLGSPDYIAAATSFYGEHTEQWWKRLGDLLGDRPGWKCEIANTGSQIELMWSFGALGSSLFNVSREEDGEGYHLFDYEADKVIVFGALEELRTWLEENEQRHVDYPRTLRGLAADNDWALLKSMPFQVDVTYDGSTWIATFRQLPLEYSSGATLTEAISNAKEAIAHAFDAPKNIAPRIQVTARLDVEAVAAL
ncbi:type II toxin-antitoxin system HicB family antitoxin [Micromonospora sp. DT81.3]|uniref:type II toxin-antitoxin system HicB family antitoxin n=1 Tax=Micromonospora sp. DT81.3 TaxID=3416523 RepID=UPI003CEF1792